uniref:GAS domain-containing protein n=1 Tax=Rhabditophanes sp. KR3021 TaxID=114890 RepID=A0AC35UEN6_9BILA
MDPPSIIPPKKEPTQIRKLVKLSLTKKGAAKKTTNKSDGDKNTKKKENIVKVEALNKRIDKLKKKVDTSEKKLSHIAEDRVAIELEKNVISSKWERTKTFLVEEQSSTIELHKKIEQMKVAHIKQMLESQKKLAVLSLKAAINLTASTQTENKFIEGVKDFHDQEIQTVADVNSDNVHEVLRLGDKKLLELIANMEREKMQMQYDFKFNLSQVEQKLKMEQDAVLRKFKNEKDSYIEEICSNHGNTISAIEKEKSNLHLSMSEQVSQLQIRNYELSEEVREKVEQYESLRHRTSDLANPTSGSQNVKGIVDGLARHTKQLEEEVKIKRQELKKMLDTTKSQRDIIDIVMGEYKKLELERDSLIFEFEKCIHAAGQMNEFKKTEILKKIAQIKGNVNKKQ